VARWTSVDPLSENYGESSPYAYVLNNPIGAVDIDGLWTQNGTGGWSTDDPREISEFITALNVAANDGGTIEYENGTGKDNEAFSMVSDGGKSNMVQIMYNIDGAKAIPDENAPVVTMIPINNTRFGINDAVQGLKAVNIQYGRDVASKVESVYRLETSNFTSGQYKNTGAAGMEAVAGSDAPDYGWPGKFWEDNPEYAPTGIWSAFENAGLSKAGGTKQNKKSKKRYVKFPSVQAGMMFLSNYIIRHNGNAAKWYGGKQDLYNQSMKSRPPIIVNSFY